MRRRLDKLMDKRLETADELGVIDRGKFFEIKRFIERPLKQFYKPPAQLKIISDPSGATIHLDDNYGDGTVMVEPGQPLVRCGQETEGASGDGCGALIPLEDYLKNFQTCPQCGKRHVLDAAGWISALADPGSFHELFRNMTCPTCCPAEDLHDYYRDFLKEAEKRSSFNESLVTAHATIYGYPAVLALSDFAFAGGSMGVVFGEKFRLAVEYALRKKWPLVSVCCSGGARLYEGIVALMQMYKTMAAVERLKRAGVPFISILADPATGGAIASYAALGDVCLAEPGALVIFTGPRVMKARGFEVEEEMVRSDSLVTYLGRHPAPGELLRRHPGHPGGGAPPGDAPGGGPLSGVLRPGALRRAQESKGMRPYRRRPQLGQQPGKRGLDLYYGRPGMTTAHRPQRQPALSAGPRTSPPQTWDDLDGPPVLRTRRPRPPGAVLGRRTAYVLPLLGRELSGGAPARGASTWYRTIRSAACPTRPAWSYGEHPGHSSLGVPPAGRMITPHELPGGTPCFSRDPTR